MSQDIPIAALYSGGEVIRRGDADMMVSMKNDSGLMRKVKLGFSWTAFFFGGSPFTSSIILIMVICLSMAFPVDALAKGFGWLSRGSSISKMPSKAITKMPSKAITKMPSKATTKSVQVKGYYRKDGTYVDSYYRSSPGESRSSQLTPSKNPISSIATLTPMTELVTAKETKNFTAKESEKIPAGMSLILVTILLPIGYFGYKKLSKNRKIEKLKNAHKKGFLSDEDLEKQIEMIV